MAKYNSEKELRKALRRLPKERLITQYLLMRWEKAIIEEQLNELGYHFGEAIRPEDRDRGRLSLKEIREEEYNRGYADGQLHGMPELRLQIEKDGTVKVKKYDTVHKEI